VAAQEVAAAAPAEAAQVVSRADAAAGKRKRGMDSVKGDRLFAVCVTSIECQSVSRREVARDSLK
jgi:hypothetical protein